MSNVLFPSWNVLFYVQTWNIVFFFLCEKLVIEGSSKDEVTLHPNLFFDI